jgi:Fur family transcriptional regulator, peroxide stress response regulator
MGPETRLQSRMEFFERRCLECGLASTHQRQILYRALAESDEHPSPEMLYEKVKQQIPAISLGTVYRNIKIFKDSGLLKEVSPLHESSRLDANLTKHHHLVCHRCHSIIDVLSEDIEPVRFRGNLPAGFEVEWYEVEVMGLCSRCTPKANAGDDVSNVGSHKKEKT